MRGWRRYKLAAFIALKIARSKKSSSLSLVTMISIIGIACGVLSLSVVLSVTNGFQSAFQDRILGVFPHLLVMRSASVFEDYDDVLRQIQDTEGVLGASPLSMAEMMASHGAYRSGATLQGIEPESMAKVLDLEGLMVEGSLEALDERPKAVMKDGALHLSSLEHALSFTVIAKDDGPLVLIDENTRPSSAYARLKVLDLRKDKGTSPLHFLPDVPSKSLQPFDIGSEASPRSWSPELSIKQGTWVLEELETRFLLDKRQQYAIVIFDGLDGPDSLLLSAQAQSEFQDRNARGRFLDLRSQDSETPLSWFLDGEKVAETEARQLIPYRFYNAHYPGVILGLDLAKRLQVKLGDDVSFITPLRGLGDGTSAPFGMMPSASRFRVLGLFVSGFYEHDSRLAFAHLGSTQRFMNKGRSIQSIAVKTASLLDVKSTKDRLVRELDPIYFEDLVDRTLQFDARLKRLIDEEGPSGLRPPLEQAPFIGQLQNLAKVTQNMKFTGIDRARPNKYQIFDWHEKNANLFSALQLQKLVMTIFFFIIILVGSFVVVGSQTMIVHEKTPDIAILKAMGASNGFIRLVFTLQGGIIAVIGLLTGLGLGLGLILLIDLLGYKLDPSIYLIDTLPVTVKGLEILWIALGTLACTLLTTQISAGRAANKIPVEGLQNVD